MKRLLCAVALAISATMMFGSVANAAQTTEVVTPDDLQGWANYDTRTGGTWELVDGPGTPPLGNGSLRLVTTTSTAKASIINADYSGTALSSVTEMGYSTYRDAGSTANPTQVPSYQLTADVNGLAVDGGFTTLVFEPVYNTTQGVVVPGTWQEWDAFNGGSARWWTTRAIPGQCLGASVTCLRTWSQIVANNPDAVLLGLIVNQGSGNAGLNANVDAYSFGTAATGTTWDFELMADADDDGVADGSDNCPSVSNGGQENNDGDSEGDACDSDDDNDNVADGDDNCPTTANGGQANNDGDSQGDACDSDDDNDTVNDGDDNCPTTANGGQADNDEDGLGDLCDSDDDNDGVPDGQDDCQYQGGAAQNGCPMPTNKDKCKDGGWRSYGTTFRNQGECVSYVASGRDPVTRKGKKHRRH